jgi:conjugative relaxase-like TrwC/TraI family protein
LGIDGELVEGPDFIALMEGKHPRTDRGLRPEGAGGGRGGGIDISFSPPKSVSALWVLGDECQRRARGAHASAVRQAVKYLPDAVPTVRRRYGGRVVEETAVDLVAAEYRHTTTRGVIADDPPDPQLHSHVVLTNAVRDDDRFVAIASRPIFRAVRELGAFDRSALAHELQPHGYRIKAGTGKEGRYFEIAGVPPGLLDGPRLRAR